MIKKRKDTFDFSTSRKYQDIYSTFNSLDNLFQSFDKVNIWVKNSFYNTKSLVGYDVFRVSSEQITEVNCSNFSEYAIVNYFINSFEKVKDLRKISIIGIDNQAKLEIAGLYDGKLILESKENIDFKNVEYCILNFDVAKSRIFYGKLIFENIN